MAEYIIIAGINGAGKSTLYATDFHKYFGEAQKHRINPDEEITKFGGKYYNFADQRKAGRISVEKMSNYFQKKLSFNQETTFSGSTELSRIKKAKSFGYKIVMFYVGVDSVDTAKERIKSRVKKGGHDIPDDIVERRYTRSIENLIKLSSLVDDLHIFDNTVELREIYWRRDDKVIVDETKSSSWLREFSKE